MNGWTKWDTAHALATGTVGGSAGFLAYLGGYGQIGCAVIAGSVAWGSSIVWEFITGK